MFGAFASDYWKVNGGVHVLVGQANNTHNPSLQSNNSQYGMAFNKTAAGMNDLRSNFGGGGGNYKTQAFYGNGETFLFRWRKKPNIPPFNKQINSPLAQPPDKQTQQNTGSINKHQDHPSSHASPQTLSHSISDLLLNPPRGIAISNSPNLDPNSVNYNPQNIPSTNPQFQPLTENYFGPAPPPSPPNSTPPVSPGVSPTGGGRKKRENSINFVDTNQVTCPDSPVWTTRISTQDEPPLSDPNGTKSKKQDKDKYGLKVFPWTGANNLFQYINTESKTLALGGGGVGGNFGLCLSGDFERGTTGPVDTFEMEGGVGGLCGVGEFEIFNVEVYGFVEE